MKRLLILLLCQWCFFSRAAEPSAASLWVLAQRHAPTHRFATLFTAQDVLLWLATDADIDRSIDWCKRTGVTKVYLEEFRDDYRAERATLLRAKQRFLDAGFLVSGCVTTTRVGKSSTGWKGTTSCYTDQATQEKLQSIFEYAAGLFDEIMIDDFWFEDCACPACDAARQARVVTIGSKTYPVSGGTWEDYRRELMFRLSQDRVLAAAKRVNPKVQIIIKYPQWYDAFHVRGYDVDGETRLFDRIWVGTETRDYGGSWGKTPQYEGYFIMRWLGGIGGPKCGGGWYDWLGTTEQTYIEQARQTVLGGARQSMLFCFGGLHRETGPADVEALRPQIPELLDTAEQVSRRQIVGVAAYKPPNSPAGGEERVFDFVGMLGLPLAPCHEFPTNAPAAFFSVHSLKDPGFAGKLAAFINAGKPVLLTDGLALRLGGHLNPNATNVQVVAVRENPERLLDLDQAQLDKMRAPLLAPLHADFRAPARVALFLFAPDGWVIENFNDHAVQVRLNGQPLAVEGRGWKYQWK